MWIECAACGKHTLFPPPFGGRVSADERIDMRSKRLRSDSDSPVPTILCRRVSRAESKCIRCGTSNTIKITWIAEIEEGEMGEGFKENGLGDLIRIAGTLNPDDDALEKAAEMLGLSASSAKAARSILKSMDKKDPTEE